MDISRHLEVIERLVDIVSPGTEASLEANGYEYNIEYSGTLYSVEISKNGMLVVRLEFKRLDHLLL